MGLLSSSWRLLSIDIILSSLSVSGCGTHNVTVCCMFRCCAKMPSVVCMKIPVCWDVMQFRLMYRYQHFRGVCCFHLQGGLRTNCLALKTEATSISEMLELVYRHTPIYEVISYTLLGIWNFFCHRFHKYIFCSECMFFVVYDDQ